MSIINSLFSGSIKREVNAQVANVMAGAFNRSVYKYLNNDQPIFLQDNANTYIEDGYLANGAVYECISLRSDKLKACPILVYEIKDDASNQKVKEFKNLYYSETIDARAKSFVLKSQVLVENNSPGSKEIHALIDKPNSKQDIGGIIENLVGCYDLLGNAYLYKNGPDVERQKWSEIFVLPANRMHIVSGGIFEPIKGYALDYLTDTELPFNTNQVDHLKTFNPQSTTLGTQLYGVPPLRPYLKQLNNDKVGNEEVAKQLKNGGTFGIASPKNPEHIFNAEQQIAFIQKLKEAKLSKDDIDRIFLGSISMDWTQIGLPIGDLMVMNILKLGREDVYRCFKVPLSFANQDSATFNNVDADNKRLIYNSIGPIARKLSDFLTKAIADPVSKRTGKRYMILIDYNSLPEMAADMSKVAEWLQKVWQLTPNEVRDVMGYGRLDTPGMDTVWVPSGLRPIEDAVISEQEFNQANQGATEL